MAFSEETVEIFKKGNFSTLVKKITASKKNKVIIALIFLLSPDKIIFNLSIDSLKLPLMIIFFIFSRSTMIIINLG